MANKQRRADDGPDGGGGGIIEAVEQQLDGQATQAQLVHVDRRQRGGDVAGQGGVTEADDRQMGRAVEARRPAGIAARASLSVAAKMAVTGRNKVSVQRAS